MCLIVAAERVATSDRVNRGAIRIMARALLCRMHGYGAQSVRRTDLWRRALRGERARRLRRPDASLAPPCAAGCLRVLQGAAPESELSRPVGTALWGSYLQSVGLCEGAERERGERSLDSVGVSLMSSGSQFVQQKNQIRPVNEAGSTVGFFPVTSCSLGKRQPESELAFTPLGCLFAAGRTSGPPGAMS